MEINGQRYISPRYRKEDYLTLKLSQNSSQEDWGKAIDIFHDRIFGRYLEPANELMNDMAKNGFAVMAIVTLLIDALAQFRKGLENTKQKNYIVYTSFLRGSLGDVFINDGIAQDFYEDIRCGILHSAQTCDNSVLTVNGDIIRKENGTLYVNVKGMYDRLVVYIQTYEEELGNLDNTELRNNFIKKMKAICKR